MGKHVFFLTNSCFRDTWHKKRFQEFRFGMIKKKTLICDNKIALFFHERTIYRHIEVDCRLIRKTNASNVSHCKFLRGSSRSDMCNKFGALCTILQYMCNNNKTKKAKRWRERGELVYIGITQKSYLLVWR